MKQKKKIVSKGQQPVQRRKQIRQPKAKLLIAACCDPAGGGGRGGTANSRRQTHVRARRGESRKGKTQRVPSMLQGSGRGCTARNCYCCPAPGSPTHITMGFCTGACVGNTMGNGEKKQIPECHPVILQGLTQRLSQSSCDTGRGPAPSELLQSASLSFPKNKPGNRYQLPPHSALGPQLACSLCAWFWW